MITKAQIERDISETVGQCYGFDYNGQSCGIDPIDDHFDMWYGYETYIAKDVDAIFSAKLYDGKTLEEILPDIKDYGIR